MTVNPDLTLSPIARPRKNYDCDYFLSGGITQSSIGRLGWTLGGTGTPVVVRANSGYTNTSKVQLTTSTATNDRATLLLGETETRLMCSPTEFENVTWVGRLAIPATSQRSFFGWSDDFSGNPLTANNAFGFNFDTSVSPFLMIVNRVGGVDLTPPYTPIDLGPLRSNIGQSLTIIQADDAPGQFDFYSTSTNGVTTTPIFLIRLSNPGFDSNHGFRVETLANVTARMDMAYWGMNDEILSGVLTSDDLLEG